MNANRILAMALAASIAGCAELLPKSATEVSSPWTSFEQAQAAIESIQLERTRAADLKAMGIHPFVGSNVTLLSYSDITLRFPANVGKENLDHGLRECLESGRSCTGYYVNVKDLKRDRVGPFWLDVFGFKRVVQTSGWTFNALVLLVDDRVVYTLHGGLPSVSEQETSRQPLGPVQDLRNIPMPH